MPNKFLLYGANGYIGKLIAKLAAAYNLQPILAGRTEVLLADMQHNMCVSVSAPIQLPHLFTPSGLLPIVQ